jgi:hypothetical protein
MSLVNTYLLSLKKTYKTCLDAFVKEDGNGKKIFSLIWGVYKKLNKGNMDFFINI